MMRRKKMVNVMVAVVLSAGVMVAGLKAESCVRYFKNGKDQTGGMIDDELIFIYREETIIKNEFSLGMLKNIAKQRLCSDISARELIVKDGMSVKFIYMGKEGTVIVKIDACDGIE